MPLFSIPELREEARKNGNEITVAVSRSNLGAGDATFHLDSWAVELINYAKTLGYTIVDINGPDLVYERFTEILQNTRPAVLFNFSHGCQSYLMGNPVNGIIGCTLTRGSEDIQHSCGFCGMPNNLKALSGTAIIAYSCHAAHQLGRCSIKYGIPCFTGFSDSLVITSDKFGTQNIFKEALLPLSKRILDGWPVGTAVEQTREDLLNTVKQYKIIELVSVPLWYDRKYLTQLGDPNWRLI
jgi:hypothetical protein